MSDRIVKAGSRGSINTPHVHDTATGADLIEAGRDRLDYVLDHRTLPIFVEYGRHPTVIVYGTSGTWDDGTPATDAQLRSAQETLELMAEFRGLKLDIVHRLDDERPYTSARPYLGDA